MHVLNPILAQLAERWHALTPKGRGLTGLAVALAVVGLVLMFRTSVGSADHYLLGGRSFSADEIPAIEAAFAKKGLSDFYVDGGRIRVSHSQQASYLAAMAEGNAL